MNNMKMKTSMFLSVLTLVLSLNVQAQSDLEAIKTLIKNFNSDAVKLVSEGSERADKIMAYASADFHYQITTINILNQVTSKSMNKKEISFVLHEMRQSNVTSKRILGNLDDIHIRGKLAFAAYEIDYELFESERLINKGHQYVYMILQKNSESTWHISSLSVTNLDDETYKSMCICEIYENKGLSNIITETIVPDGSDATVIEDKFSIDENVEPRNVRHGYKDYLWAANGAIYRRNLDGTQGDQIGKAGSRQELLLSLLKNEVYPDRCNSVIRKLK